VEAEGEGRLGQALSTVVLGDFVSVYVAFMYAMDPTPVDVIEHIKEQLALADQAGAD
jgi:glucose/mannose-6-phosphate isomerase